ncbi:MAG: hypothetical protein JKY98_12220 [Gammaproteobacteria bacterium]|nr:hypothetical protein [Gammaproteobacteria bacterium]
MKLIKIYSGIFLFLCLTPSWAAEAPKEDSEQENNAQISSGEQQRSEVDPATSPEEDSELEAEKEQQSSSRFIPTEQVSQDLGVSFPVDI